MNSKPPAKYSLEPLPGDSWEVRRTKQVARAILRAKNNRGLTTERLARLCNLYLNEADAIKASTLNGLFAGKRKSISIAELQMFAYVLGYSLLDLTFPPGELVEVRPGVTVTSVDALVDCLMPTLSPNGARSGFGSRADGVMALARESKSLGFALGNAVRALESGSKKAAAAAVENLKWRVKAFKTTYSALAQLDEMMPTLPATATWALDIEADALDSPEFLLTLGKLADETPAHSDLNVDDDPFWDRPSRKLELYDEVAREGGYGAMQVNDLSGASDEEFEREVRALFDEAL